MKHSMKLYITEDDFNILETAAAIHEDQKLMDLLDEELANAEVVPYTDIPEDIVTIRSRARVLDESSNEIREFTVVPPGEEGDIASGRISVLSPMGRALIGLAEGQMVDLPLPRGGTKRLRLLEVVYQPEAAARGGRGYQHAA